MAKPRVFISSTFYDLRHVREDLERFVRELGYEPVRHETGAITYGKDEPPEEYAYREVELCDIIVAIIGSRFGSQSQQQETQSISQRELSRALERKIQVFIFVEKSVLSEYGTYQLNKTTKNIKYKFVDDARIYEFVETLHGLPRNNPIAPFETAADITGYLRAQWAGLFQRFLQEQQRTSELKILEEMKAVAATLQDVTLFLTAERSNKDEAFKSILLMSHPAFRRFAQLTDTPYRVFFTNRRELQTWLSARNWKPVPEEHYDEGSIAEWSNPKAHKYLRLIHPIFDSSGRLEVFTEADWSDEWLAVEALPPTDDEFPPADDDPPF